MNRTQMTNERLCTLAQQGDISARDRLVEQNLGFLRDTAGRMYKSLALAESSLAIGKDDLMQEGCLGLLSAIDSFDPPQKAKFLTYAAPAIRNAMIDFVRSQKAIYENRVVSDGSSKGFSMKRIYLDEILSTEERLLRIEAIADPYEKTPTQIVLEAERLEELYAALDKLTQREQAYLLYRFGFTDDEEHPLIGAAVHFHLTESRAKKLEANAMDNLWLELPWWYEQRKDHLITAVIEALIALCKVLDEN